VNTAINSSVKEGFMNSKRSLIVLSILNIIGFLGTIVVNGLANALPINNLTTGELSDKYPNLFVPAALTFSIWGAIYLLLAIFVVYQAVLAFGKNGQDSAFSHKIGVLFFISSIANMGWIFAWHYEILPLSVVLMLLLLGTLIAIYLRLNIGRSNATNREKYLVHLPFSVYLGWITIATIANITTLLVSLNWNTFGLGEQFWTVAVIVVGIAIALAVLIRRRDAFYCLVIDWALLGILLKRFAASVNPESSIITIVIAGMVLITLGILVQTVRRKVY